MISNTKKWSAVIAICLLIIPPVNLQVAMYPVFQPMHVAVPMPIPILVREREPITTTTTTTTESIRAGVAYPVGVPVAVPFAFPAFAAVSCQARPRGKNCPPCPPCLCQPTCTPAFFSYCSPCHQKCRCRSKEETPVPVPPRPAAPPMGPAYGIAVPVPHIVAPPPPVIVVPFPPQRPRLTKPSSSSSDTECTDDSSSSSSDERRRKRRKKYGHSKRRPIYGRRFESIETSDNELVKPVLTYISQDGDVKLKRRLSRDEAAELMNDKPYQKINVLTGSDDDKSRILIQSVNERNPRRTNHRRKQVVLSAGTAQHILGEGKKELVFKPAGGKKISNLSVSFQISE